MRRFLAIILGLSLLASTALAADLGKATDALFDAIMGLEKPPQGVTFAEAGPWMSGVAGQADANWRWWRGFVYDMQTEAMLTWDDLFADGDFAAAQLEAIAQAGQYDNAYAEHTDIVPMPRDNFAVADDQLTVYYPPEQLSYFSGRAGAFSFYAFELDGLLRETVPLAVGDVAKAGAARDEVLAQGALPGALSPWALGSPMADAAQALDLVDVPDLTHDYAVWHFEAPQMRGVALLSSCDEDDEATATITGIQTERIDFSGLCTGIATRDTCVATLGEADRAETLASADAYSRLPEGETLYWDGDVASLALHFFGDVLHSVALLAR